MLRAFGVCAFAVQFQNALGRDNSFFSRVRNLAKITVDNQSVIVDNQSMNNNAFTLKRNNDHIEFLDNHGWTVGLLFDEQDSVTVPFADFNWMFGEEPVDWSAVLNSTATPAEYRAIADCECSR